MSPKQVSKFGHPHKLGGLNKNSSSRLEGSSRNCKRNAALPYPRSTGPKGLPCRTGLRLLRKNLTPSAQARTTQNTEVTETSFSLLICFPHPPLSRASQSQTDPRTSPSAILSCARNWHHKCSFHSLFFTIRSPFLNVCCIIFLLLSVHFLVKFQDCYVPFFIQPNTKHSSL